MPSPNLISWRAPVYFAYFNGSIFFQEAFSPRFKDVRVDGPSDRPHLLLSPRPAAAAAAAPQAAAAAAAASQEEEE